MTGTSKSFGLFALALAVSVLLFSACEPREQVKWDSFNAEKLEAAKAGGKSSLVYFYAAWCAPCMKMKYDTFTDPRVIEALGGFARLKADMSFSRSKKVQELSYAFQIRAIPTMIWIDSSGRERSRMLGYISAEQLLSYLDMFRP